MPKRTTYERWSKIPKKFSKKKSIQWWFILKVLLRIPRWGWGIWIRSKVALMYFCIMLSEILSKYLQDSHFVLGKVSEYNNAT